MTLILLLVSMQVGTNAAEAQTGLGQTLTGGHVLSEQSRRIEQHGCPAGRISPVQRQRRDDRNSPANAGQRVSQFPVHRPDCPSSSAVFPQPGSEAPKRPSALGNATAERAARPGHANSAVALHLARPESVNEPIGIDSPPDSEQHGYLTFE
jgi:hypothetical protein